MSYLDVFKDFEYEDEQEQPPFQDVFSQLLNEPSSTQPDSPSMKPVASTPLQESPTDPRAHLTEYEEAFTVLKSIEAAHEPFSYTAINAYLYYKRGIDTSKRSAQGLVWPEHPESFHDSRLLSEHTEYDESEVLCELSQSEQLQAALSKACQSIWRQKAPPSAHLDPLFLDSIAQRTALLLQATFDRAVLNRKSAIKILKKFPQTTNVDVDYVPVDWQSSRAAAKQLIGQAGLDSTTFTAFSTRLDPIFSQNISK